MATFLHGRVFSRTLTPTVLALSITAILTAIPATATAQDRTRPGLIAGGEANFLATSAHSGVEGGLVLRSLGVLSPAIGGTYLKGEDGRLGAFAFGAGIPLSLGRVRVRPFGYFLLGRLETVADAGGYHTVDGTYHPYWRPVSATSSGGAGGVALGWTLRPGLTLEGSGRYLTTSKGEEGVGIDGFYGGLGLRYLLPGARPAPRVAASPALVLEPETVVVAIEEPGPALEPEPTPEPVAAPPVARLAGRVVDGLSGRPLSATIRLAATSAELARKGAAGPGRDGVEDSAALPLVYSDASGRFETPVLPAGTYDLAVVADGYVSTTYHSVSLGAEAVGEAGGEAVVVLRDIPLVPERKLPASLAGHIARAGDGGPLAGARVVLRSGISPLERAAERVVESDARGRFTFEGLEPGVYTLEVVRGLTGAVVIVAVPSGGRTTINILPRLPETELP